MEQSNRSTHLFTGGQRFRDPPDQIVSAWSATEPLLCAVIVRYTQSVRLGAQMDTVAELVRLFAIQIIWTPVHTIPVGISAKLLSQFT